MSSHGSHALHRRRRWPRVVAAVASGAVLVATAAGAGFAHVYTNLEGNISTLDLGDGLGGTPSTGSTPSPTASVIDDQGNYTALNILLMGSDSRQGADNAGYGDAAVYGGERSDTAILLHLSADRTRALAVSIPRDTFVDIPECAKRGGGTGGGFRNRINVAFEVGGAGCTVKTLRQLTGVRIDHVMVVDFGGFKRIIDAMGGVDVCLKNPVDDEKSHLKLPAGTSTVMGEQALAFVRARKTLGDGSDLGRIQRQQAFLASLLRKVESTSVLSNPADLYGILDAATQSLATDGGLATLDALRQLAESVRGLKPKQVSFVTMPWVARGDGATVVMDAEKAAPMWAAMNDDTPYPPKKDKNPVVKTAPAAVRVQVLNGSGISGRAAEVAAALAARGFQVVGTGAADRSDYTAPVVLFDPSRDESARTLSSSVVGSTSRSEATGSSVLTLVVGSDPVTVRAVTVEGTTSAPTTTGDTAGCY